MPKSQIWRGIFNLSLRSLIKNLGFHFWQKTFQQNTFWHFIDFCHTKRPSSSTFLRHKTVIFWQLSVNFFSQLKDKNSFEALSILPCVKKQPKKWNWPKIIDDSNAQPFFRSISFPKGVGWKELESPAVFQWIQVFFTTSLQIIF